MRCSVFIRNDDADCGGKWRLPSRNESRGFEIKINATEMQADHNQPDTGKGRDQQFPDQREGGIGSWTLISDTI